MLKGNLREAAAFLMSVHCLFLQDECRALSFISDVTMIVYSWMTWCALVGFYYMLAVAPSSADLCSKTGAYCWDWVLTLRGVPSVDTHLIALTAFGQCYEFSSRQSWASSTSCAPRWDSCPVSKDPKQASSYWQSFRNLIGCFVSSWCYDLYLQSSLRKKAIFTLTCKKCKWGSHPKTELIQIISYHEDSYPLPAELGA